MFNLDHIVRTASAAVCSLIFTAVMVGAAIGPVSSPASEPTTVAAAASGGESAHG